MEQYRAAELVLHRERHIDFVSSLLEDASTDQAAFDACRPALLYWIVHTLALLDVDSSSRFRERAVATLASCRPHEACPRSGFGGGPGQRMTLANTFAAVMVLAEIADERIWSDPRLIDRHAMYAWLLSLKCPDGGFTMHRGGEHDVRGVYCALAIATLLNMLTAELVAGTASYLASCQTYEGGVASSSTVFANRVPLGEAHGGYAFCALASHFMLLPMMTHAHTARQECSGINLATFARWAASMQGVPEEGGGFRGRTNKSIDGCYTWWAGGLWPILEALEGDGCDMPDETSPFDRELTQAYVLAFAQDRREGGLRAALGEPSDMYHSCFDLSGLSSAQHRMNYAWTRCRSLRDQFVRHRTVPLIQSHGESEQAAFERMASVYAGSRAWNEDYSRMHIVGPETNQLVRGRQPLVFLVSKQSARSLLIPSSTLLIDEQYACWIISTNKRHQPV